MYEAFINRKSGEGSSYNYDLKPLIENFTFYDFVANTRKYEEHGGFLIITNNQYIVGYNAGFGVGTHMASFARAMVNINDEKESDITNEIDVYMLYKNCVQNYLVSRIVYEPYEDEETGRIKFYGSISFNLTATNKKITPQQFEIFKQFYNDHNEDIKYVTQKFKFFVAVNYLDETGKEKYKVTEDLDFLYNYLENNIDNNKEIPEEKIIIGKGINNRKKD